MIKATLDTNILVSAFLFPGNERRALKAAVQGRFRSMTSPAILDELGEVLTRLGVGDHEAEGYIMRIMEVSDVVIPMRLDEVDVRDRGDVKILECALSGGSDYIVTGDEDLLSLGEYRGVKMMRTMELLERLSTNEVSDI
ncbi:MAG: putative toxin-antitoxin system toxin component, PIN family [Desulfobacterales bacterium]|nr:putative toxin-antitoxin system toxin component, PIN family [Desulfobacterales bacterium]